MTNFCVPIYSFEMLVSYLREKETIRITKNCLQRVHILTTLRHGSPPKALGSENVNVRVFLAAFMIAFKPTHVFDSMGVLEQALFESAGPLLTKFQRIVEATASSASFASVSSDVTFNFPLMLFEYFKRFKAWKVPDEAKLVCRIKHALVALYQAELQLPPDEPEDSKLKIEFTTQIVRLRSKLEQISGPDALDAFDIQRKAGRAGLSNGSNGVITEARITMYTTLPGRITNEQLAHELLLDPGFALDDVGGSGLESSVQHNIRESFHEVSGRTGNFGH